jgi:hypothetical protein
MDQASRDRSNPFGIWMIGAFVSIECVSCRFGRHIRCDLEPLHEWLRPCAIGASPFCRLLRRRQYLPGCFKHAYNFTPLFLNEGRSAKRQTTPPASDCLRWSVPVWHHRVDGEAPNDFRSRPPETSLIRTIRSCRHQCPELQALPSHPASGGPTHFVGNSR